MHALAVTILISLCLAGIFIVSYCLESKRRRNGSSSLEHDALLPFDDEDEALALEREAPGRGEDIPTRRVN